MRGLDCHYSTNKVDTGLKFIGGATGSDGLRASNVVSGLVVCYDGNHRPPSVIAEDVREKNLAYSRARGIDIEVVAFVAAERHGNKW